MLSRAVAALLLLTATTARADVAISPARDAAAYRSQWVTSIAAGSDGYFVVWNDGRRDGPSAGDVFGSRVDANGKLLDPTGILISDEAGGAAPAVLATPAGYAVFWTVNSYCGRARLFDTNGLPLTPVKTFPCGYIRDISSIATNGRSFAVMNADGAIIMIDEHLQYVGATSVGELAGSKRVISGAAVASDGETYLVATVEESPARVVTYTIGADRQLLHPPAQIGISAGVSPRLVYTGRDYVLTISAADGPRVQRINRDGTASGAAVPVALDASVDDLASRGDGSAIVVGTKYLSYGSETETHAVVITDAASQPQVLSKSLRSTHVACSKSGCMLAGNTLAYVLGTIPTGGVVTIALDSEGKIRDGSDPAAVRSEMTRSATAQTNFAALRGTPSRLVAWEEAAGDGHSTVMLRDLENPSDAGHVVFAEANAIQAAPALATNGSVTLLVWHSIDLTTGSTHVEALRLASDGTALDPKPLVIAPSVMPTTLDSPFAAPRFAPSPPAVAWSESMFLVAFPGKDSALRVAKISSSGVVVDEGSTAVAPPLRAREPQSFPVLVPAGDEVFLLWQEGVQPYQCVITCPILPPALVRMTRLSPDGLPIDATPTLIDDRVALTPDAAWNGSGLLAVWQRDETMWGRFFGHDGSATSPTFSLGRSLEHFPPSVMARPDGLFDVAWILEVDLTTWYGGVVASRVGPSGPSPLLSLGDTFDQRTPRLWLTPSSQSAVAYERISYESSIMLVPRIRYQPLDPFGARRRLVGR